MNSSFPLHGVIGVVENTIDEVDLAVKKGLQCVEIRADLIFRAGHSQEQLMAIVRYAVEQKFGVLFTLRHPTHGGHFEGEETQRAQISKEALNNGAHLVDLEFETEAANLLLAENAPLVLSYHNFNAMLSAVELEELTQRMLALNPKAIKVVPMASKLAHAVQMLNWVAAAADQSSSRTVGVTRIGFAMGQAGQCSRILTVAYGGALTYSTFTDATAPGQIDIDEMITRYRASSLNNTSRVTALIQGDTSETKVERLNAEFSHDNSANVAIVFASEFEAELASLKDALRIDEIQR